MAKKKKIYAVNIGRKPGIYNQWYGENGAETQVKGFPKALYKGFATREEAETFLRHGYNFKPTKKYRFSKKKQNLPKKRQIFEKSRKI